MAKKLKDNPLLITVNPSDDGKIEKIWEEAKTLKPDVSRAQFDAGMKQYWQQHHSLPASLSVEDIPVRDDVQVMAVVGNVEEIFYKPDSSSRKNKDGETKYIHKTKSEKLATDSSGKMLILYGTTEMKPDGWLHD